MVVSAFLHQNEYYAAELLGKSASYYQRGGAGTVGVKSVGQLAAEGDHSAVQGLHDSASMGASIGGKMYRWVRGSFEHFSVGCGGGSM